MIMNSRLRSILLIFTLSLMSGVCRQLKPHGQPIWIGNTRFTEYRGVTIAQGGWASWTNKEYTTKEDALRECTRTPTNLPICKTETEKKCRRECIAVTETSEDKWRLVEQMALVGADESKSIFYKSGKRTVTKTIVTRQITVSKWVQIGEYKWGYIAGFTFHSRSLYGEKGTEDVTRQKCMEDTKCIGISEVEDGVWQKGKGRQLDKGGNTWVIAKRLGKVKARDTGPTDGWHRTHLNIRFGNKPAKPPCAG